MFDLEIGSIIVLSCKRIKDMQFYIEEQEEKIVSMTSEYENLLSKFQDKA